METVTVLPVSRNPRARTRERFRPQLEPQVVLTRSDGFGTDVILLPKSPEPGWFALRLPQTRTRLLLLPTGAQCTRRRQQGAWYGLNRMAGAQISVRCYAELNEFLRLEQRHSSFAWPLERRTSVKDLIESLGVPHTEVDLILVNGESVDFSYLVQDGDSISVYPRFRSLEIACVTQVRPPHVANLRFVLDTHLGKLATSLRMLGFDTHYQNDADDLELVRIASAEQRILLSRDRGLLKRAAVTHGAYIHADEPEQQLVEMVHRFGLASQAKPFSRCLRCNDLLEAVEKADILERLEPKTRRYYHEFRQCPSCARLYWKGSHHDDMQQRYLKLLPQRASGPVD